MFFVYAATIAVVLFVWFQLFYSQKFFVEPNKRERRVLENIVTGKMQVIGPGAHFRSPSWRELAVVDLNREPVSVPAKNGDPGEEFRSKDGVLGLIEYRFDMLAGRPFDKDTGHLMVNDLDDESEVRDDVIILAVTRIDFSNREVIIREKVKAAVDAVLGNWESDWLFRPSKYGITATEMYRDRAKEIEDIANCDLVYTGINITALRITNMKPAGKRLQDAIEQEAASARIADAADLLIERTGGAISHREAMVASDPTAFSQVTQAEATRSGAEAIAAGFKGGLEAIANAIRKK